MEFNFLQQKKKQNVLTIVLAVCSVLIIIIVVRSFVLKGKEAMAPISSAELFKRNISIDLSVLSDPRVGKLEPFERIPAFEGEAGRENPFMPLTP